jgi:HlyD family secretion protein
MKSKKKIIAAVAIAAVILVPLLIKAGRGDASKEVEIAVAASQEIRPTILASGVIAYRNAIAREEATRRQSIISIERQRLALALARTRLARGEQLLQQKMIGQSEFDDLKNARDLAQVELQSSEEALRRADAILGEAREQLSKTDIRAPISGVIVALPIKVGETAIASTNAFAGAQLMQIADTSAIEAQLKVDEADIAKISLGQQVDVYAAAFPETAIKGTVQQVALAPTLENQGRSYLVTAVLTPPEGMALRSGMSARADIFLGDGGTRLAVPVEAVGTDVAEDRKVTRYVWLDREGRARKVIVEVGQSDDKWEEITSGVSEGDRVIRGPARILRGLVEGERVSEAKPADRAAAAKAEAEAEDEEESDSE